MENCELSLRTRIFWLPTIWLPTRGSARCLSAYAFFLVSMAATVGGMQSVAAKPHSQGALSTERDMRDQIRSIKEKQCQTITQCELNLKKWKKSLRYVSPKEKDPTKLAEGRKKFERTSSIIRIFRKTLCDLNVISQCFHYANNLFSELDRHNKGQIAKWDKQRLLSETELLNNYSCNDVQKCIVKGFGEHFQRACDQDYGKSCWMVPFTYGIVAKHGFAYPKSKLEYQKKSCEQGGALECRSVAKRESNTERARLYFDRFCSLMKPSYDKQKCDEKFKSQILKKRKGKSSASKVASSNRTKTRTYTEAPTKSATSRFSAMDSITQMENNLRAFRQERQTAAQPYNWDAAARAAKTSPSSTRSISKSKAQTSVSSRGYSSSKGSSQDPECTKAHMEEFNSYDRSKMSKAEYQALRKKIDQQVKNERERQNRCAKGRKPSSAIRE